MEGDSEHRRCQKRVLVWEQEDSRDMAEGGLEIDIVDNMQDMDETLAQTAEAVQVKLTSLPTNLHYYNVADFPYLFSLWARGC